METYNTTQEQNLQNAQRKVKKMKGFYTHVIVYVCVNLLIFIGNYYESSNNIVKFDTYATAVFWGIGLFAHALSVFGGDFFFGRNWEERKIQEILNQK